MYFSIFALWSSIITNLDFSAVQSVILSISVVVGGSCLSWLPNTCISLAGIKELDLEKAHEPQHPSLARSMEEDQLFNISIEGLQISRASASKMRRGS